MKALRLRLAISVMVLFVVMAYALPNIPFIGSSPLGALMEDRINLGLDLKGGMNLTLGVDMDKALQNALSVTGQDVRDRANQEKITVMKPRLNAEGKLEVVLPRADQVAAFEEMMGKWFPNLVQASSIPNASGRVYQYELSAELRRLTEEMTMEQVVRTIRNRIDQFGVAEPDIRRQSDNQVQVQLPGMTDAERAVQIIGQTAHLEFRLVRDDVDPGAMMLPAGTARFPLIHKGRDGSVSESVIVLESEALMGGEDITNARPAFNEFGQAYVSLEFNGRGASNFERITGDNIKKRMAIVLDGKVYSAPTIQDRISGGKASITGGFTTEEAQDLAIVLRAGSLPTPVTILEERTVGPSLGKESINSGIKASLVGAAAVVIIMPLSMNISDPVFRATAEK
ncbi:MAG: protein translocase subunit SecD [Mailhella sp.]|nr:protein translocase subunit SecD [Mailhella sp.]